MFARSKNSQYSRPVSPKHHLSAHCLDHVPTCTYSAHAAHSKKHQTSQQSPIILGQTKVMSFTAGAVKHRSRSLQAQRFKEHPDFISYTIKNRAFCHECMCVVERRLPTFSSKAKGAFIPEGFKNWKKAKEKFADYESSHCHREDHMKLESLKKPDILTHLDMQDKTDQPSRRELFMTEL